MEDDDIEGRPSSLSLSLSLLLAFFGDDVGRYVAGRR